MLPATGLEFNFIWLQFISAMLLFHSQYVTIAKQSVHRGDLDCLFRFTFHKFLRQPQNRIISTIVIYVQQMLKDNYPSKRTRLFTLMFLPWQNLHMTLTTLSYTEKNVFQSFWFHCQHFGPHSRTSLSFQIQNDSHASFMIGGQATRVFQ